MEKRNMCKQGVLFIALIALCCDGRLLAVRQGSAPEQPVATRLIAALEQPATDKDTKLLLDKLRGEEFYKTILDAGLLGVDRILKPAQFASLLHSGLCRPADLVMTHNYLKALKRLEAGEELSSRDLAVLGDAHNIAVINQNITPLLCDQLASKEHTAQVACTPAPAVLVYSMNVPLKSIQLRESSTGRTFVGAYREQPKDFAGEHTVLVVPYQQGSLPDRLEFEADNGKSYSWVINLHGDDEFGVALKSTPQSSMIELIQFKESPDSAVSDKQLWNMPY